MSGPILTFEDVSITYANGARAARRVSFSVGHQECLALVGESGCGKSTLAHAALGLLPTDARVQGSILLDGVQVIGASPRTLRRLRGHIAGYVPQDPVAACDPVHSVGHHVTQAWRVHGQRPRRGHVATLLEQLGIAEAATRARQRPHQWSGGMLQRATIAAAGAHHPSITIADEPTSAVDADRAREILHATRRAGHALLLVSHDLALVDAHADRIAVLYAGSLVEHGDVTAILRRPRHPYTRALLAAIPRPGHGLPEPLAGAPPDLRKPVTGCPFAPRCPLADQHCRDHDPPLVDHVACWKAP